MRRAVLALTLVAAMAACGRKAEEPVVPEALPLVVTAGPTMNVYNGRSHPVVLRVYQLRETGAFEAAPFMELFSGGSAALGPAVVDVTIPAPVFPGETRLLKLDVHPRAVYLAAFAEFADFAAQDTRAAILIDPETREAGYRIVLDGSGVTVAAGAKADAFPELAPEKRPPWWKRLFGGGAAAGAGDAATGSAGGEPEGTDGGGGGA